MNISLAPQTFTDLDTEKTIQLCEKILAIVCQHKRIDSNNACADAECYSCIFTHLSRTAQYVQQNLPITFVLPGFPCKSPNPNKVLGHIPDRAEILALQFLNNMCEKIKQIYSPGARVIICSDGRVFADAIGVPDEHISQYQDTMARLISQYGGENLGLFTLDHCGFATTAPKMRMHLDCEYGENINELKSRIKSEPELMRMYLGMTRFLFEDRLTPDYHGSRASLQKISRTNAYTVLSRSRAWGRLVRDNFEYPIRLSIHPQSCGSEKLGIVFGETSANNWYTPWHSVAVLSDSGYEFMQHRDALRKNYTLVTVDNQPSHFVAE